jgi:predicted transcriptional regulator
MPPAKSSNKASCRSALGAHDAQRRNRQSDGGRRLRLSDELQIAFDRREIQVGGTREIRVVMTPDIDVVTPDDALRTAAQLMTDLDLDALPASDSSCLIGMITGAMRVVAHGCDPREAKVGQAMSR